jgi:aryl-alcohol dehydrogenase-like predicted oxidoreductase
VSGEYDGVSAMIEKLVLGTAALGGEPYGRSKQSVDEITAVAVIESALASGIKIIDTAPSYGQAEARIGVACRRASRSVRVITKTSGDQDIAARSLERLGCGSDVEFFWHNWTQGTPRPSWVSGATVYGREGYKSCLGIYSQIQVDWNILSQFREHKHHETVFGRSVFLQGVLAGAMPPDNRLIPLVERAERFAHGFGVNLPTLALRAALENPFIDYVVIGPNSLSNLRDIIEIAQGKWLGLTHLLPILSADDYTITDPRTWWPT